MYPFPQTAKTIPWTELPPANPDSLLAAEWETYRREVGRLLAEGKEGKFALIKGDEIIGIYETWDEAPILCRGLIDTGTDITCVNSTVLRRLGLNKPSVHATTQTVSGPAQVDLFEVSVNVLDLSHPSGPKLLFPTLRIMEPPKPMTSFDVLIGLDVPLTARLFLDGPVCRFTLYF